MNYMFSPLSSVVVCGGGGGQELKDSHINWLCGCSVHYHRKAIKKMKINANEKETKNMERKN